MRGPEAIKTQTRAHTFGTIQIVPVIKSTKPVGRWQGSEHDFQVQAMRLVRTIAAQNKVSPLLCMHIPNGGKYAHPRIAAKMKQAGVVAGYPDIMVFAPCRNACGLALELKVYPNRPTPAQLQVHQLLSDCGWTVAVAYSIDDVMNILNAYW